MWWIEPPAQQKPDLKEDGNGKNGKKGPPTTTATMGKGEQGEAGDREAGGVGSVDVGAEPEEGRTPFRKLQRGMSALTHFDMMSVPDHFSSCPSQTAVASRRTLT